MANIKTIISIFVINSFLQTVFLQRYQPTLEVTSCTRSQFKITIRGAADGGIVYIQGTGTLCRQSTQSGVSEHVFDVHSCSLGWEKKFRVVVQRNPKYLTGADKRFPVTCKPDTSDITVGNKVVNVNVLDKEDEEDVIKTVTPTATMSLYRDGVDVNGQTVELTDQLTMIIQLNNDHADDFDIEAIECQADSIKITKDGCPTDAVLFPKFTHVAQGNLQSTFGVFRPTQLVGGTVNMEFTCTLEVFLKQHIPKTCRDNVGAPANYKRKLQASNKRVNEILVGNSLLVNTEDLTEKRAPVTSVNHFEKEHVYITIIVILSVFALLALLAFCCTRRQLKEERKLRRKEHKKHQRLYYDPMERFL